MPTSLRLKGYRISFFAADSEEPVHVHVKRERKEAKFWIDPTVRLARNKGFRPHELNEIERILVANHGRLMETWNDYFRT
jgi:hypothetical protein